MTFDSAVYRRQLKQLNALANRAVTEMDERDALSIAPDDLYRPAHTKAAGTIAEISQVIQSLEAPDPEYAISSLIDAIWFGSRRTHNRRL